MVHQAGLGAPGLLVDRPGPHYVDCRRLQPRTRVSHLTALLCLSVSVAFWLPLWGHSDHLASGHQMTFGSLAFWKSPEG